MSAILIIIFKQFVFLFQCKHLFVHKNKKQDKKTKEKKKTTIKGNEKEKKEKTTDFISINSIHYFPAACLSFPV